MAKYQDIKAQRIVEVEEAIKQIRAEERAHTQKAVQLATHWEVEAQRQAAVATTGEAAVLRRQLDNLSAENNELRRQLLDSRTEASGLNPRGICSAVNLPMLKGVRLVCDWVYTCGVR